MEVNERIVNTWLNEYKKHFTITGIDYGQFHNDVDILSVDLINNEIWDCEVKVRTGSTKISETNNKQNGFLHFTSTFKDPNRIEKINQYFPQNNNSFILRQKFITTKSLFGSELNRVKWIEKFKQKEIEVVFFDEIIEDLSRYSKELKKSNNEIIQVLRLFFINYLN